MPAHSHPERCLVRRARMAHVWIEANNDDATEIDVFPWGSVQLPAMRPRSPLRRLAAPIAGIVIGFVSALVIELAGGGPPEAIAAPPIVERVESRAIAAEPAVATAPIVE